MMRSEALWVVCGVVGWRQGSQQAGAWPALNMYAAVLLLWVHNAEDICRWYPPFTSDSGELGMEVQPMIPITPTGVEFGKIGQPKRRKGE
jgi:hypothetical protein